MSKDQNLTTKSESPKFDRAAIREINSLLV